MTDFAACAAEIAVMKVELAVCRDRVERHDSEIRLLMRDVHEIKLDMGKVVGGLDRINADLVRLTEKIVELAEHGRTVDGAVDRARGAWIVVAKAGAVVVGGSSFVVLIGKAAGWWA